MTRQLQLGASREKGEDFLNTYELSAGSGGGTRIDRKIDMPTPARGGRRVLPAGPGRLHQAGNQQGHEDAEGEAGGRRLDSAGGGAEGNGCRAPVRPELADEVARLESWVM